MNPHASRPGLEPVAATNERVEFQAFPGPMSDLDAASLTPGTPAPARPGPINSFTSHTYNLSPLFSTLTRPSRLTILFSNTYENRKNLRQETPPQARFSGRKTLAPGASLGNRSQTETQPPQGAKERCTTNGAKPADEPAVTHLV